MYNRHDISLPPLSKFHLSATNYLTCISSPMINLPLSETLASRIGRTLEQLFAGGGKKRKWRALDVYENNRDNSTWKLSAWILIAIRATRANISRFRGSSTRRWRRSHTGRGSCCKRNLRECKISGEEAAYRDASCTTSFPWRAWIFLERGGGRDRERQGEHKVVKGLDDVRATERGGERNIPSGWHV